MRKDYFGNNELPFEVPENYFVEFEEKLMRRVAQEETHDDSENSIAPIISIVKPWLAMAGGFLLIALVYYQAPRIFSDQMDEVSEVTISGEDLINSVALIVDENEINELIVNEDSAYHFGTDSSLIKSITEEELAALTYFD
ncbi:hypothetical protein [Marinilabilia rubra]|uniref:Uncharacterized protein n=1 Tax=Marinilabilia rubra TaxID=2162893 RepID=A0A2U2BEB2_9BACT|nr:hypothetical protein [Marinilabilia rubra]PWE01357.1 hypothetical protein DDZ16_02410 [Marinilabilia rubra]